MNRALLIVDVQNDFCPGGALAVPKGDAVIEPINRLIKHAIVHDYAIYASRDWHPMQTKHFDRWPVHCVQNTWGARFHPALAVPDRYDKFRIISKGLGDDDGYSAIEHSACPAEPIVGVCGLATDYCVLSTVLKGVALGYRMTLFADACRALDAIPGDGDRAIAQMQALGVEITTTDEFIKNFS